MKREDLFHAMGEMDEVFLSENEMMPVQKPKRIIWRTALVAAMIACLTITAMAAVVTELVGRAQTEERTGLVTDIDGAVLDVYDVNSVDVYIEWDMEPSDTVEIRRFYAPAALDDADLNSFDFEQVDQDDDRITSYTLGWKLDGFRDDEFIQFTQFSSAGYAPDVAVDTIEGVPMDAEGTTRTLERDGMLYLLVNVDQSVERQNTGNRVYWSDWLTVLNRLYWTDGACIYRLVYPGWMEDEQILDIAASMKQVDNIWPYMDIANQNQREAQEKEWKEFRETYASNEAYTVAADAAKGWTQWHEYGYLDVFVDLSLSEDAPMNVERALYPRYMDDMEMLGLSQVLDTNGLLSFHMSWGVPGEEIRYGQYGAADYLVSGNVGTVNEIGKSDRFQSGLVDLGAYRFYEVSFAQGHEGSAGFRYLYWTDGAYIFYLRVPYVMEEAEILNIVDSIR